MLVFICFTYGLFIPIMFPIAILGLFNLYIIEKLNVAYFNHKPPTLDAKLNHQAIETLKYAPIPLFFFGYWALSNP